MVVCKDRSKLIVGSTMLVEMFLGIIDLALAEVVRIVTYPTCIYWNKYLIRVQAELGIIS